MMINPAQFNGSMAEWSIALSWKDRGAERLPIGSNPITSASFNGAVSELPSKQWHRKGSMQVRILPALPVCMFYGCVVESGLWRRT